MKVFLLNHSDALGHIFTIDTLAIFITSQAFGKAKTILFCTARFLARANVGCDSIRS